MDVRPGSAVGSYVVEELLGRGETAAVYRARRGGEGPAVALKVPDAGVLLRDPSARARFERETRIAGELEGDGIVRLLDSGRAGPRPYLVFELVEGARPLTEACPGSPLAERVRWVRDAARALGAAHARGVVHRDVKPANVLVGARGRVRVADLGYAVALGEEPLTRSGEVGGTTGYLAPEVLRDGSRVASARSDVWSLGVLLYEVATGAPPFAGAGAGEGWAQAREGAPPPSARNPAVPAAVDALCLQALAFAPEARPADGEAFAGALDAWVEAQPSKGRSSPAPAGPAPGAHRPRPHDGAARAGPERVSPSPSGAPPETTPGWIGPYRVLGTLGQGGMGRVYRAFDGAAGRPVALKVLAPGREGSRVALRRFEREAEAASRVRHPHLVSVHAYGEEDGFAYLVLELVPGTDLAARIAEGPLEPPEACRIAAGLAGALAALHERGIVHRDVKPGNVLVDPDGVAKLADFGLARLSDATRLTRSDAVLGTPTYMAPEQLRGEGLDARADVYSLGAVLYELLTGRPPVIAHTAAELLAAKHRSVPAPSRANPRLGPHVDRVCRDALAIDPDERYPTAAAFGADLERLTRGEAARGAAPRLGVAPRTKSLVRGLLVAGAALLVVVAAGLAASGDRVPAPTLASLRAEVEAQVAARDALADLELAPLGRRLEAASHPPAEAGELWSWVGLAALARGDEARARAALARVGRARAPPAAALRGGLALAADRPADALEGLDPRAVVELGFPEPARWRLRARAVAGLAGRDDAERALDELARLEGAGLVRGDAGRVLEVRCALALGDRDRAEAALERLPEPPAELPWEVALLGAAEEVRAGDLSAAGRRLAGLEPPSGPPSARAERLADRVLRPVVPHLDELDALRGFGGTETGALRDRIELYGRIAPGRGLSPEHRRRVVALLSSPLADVGEETVLTFGEAFRRDREIVFHAATHSDLAEEVEDAVRFEALARRALARCGPRRRPRARLALTRALVDQDRCAEALAHLARLEHELAVGPETGSDELAGRADLLRAAALRRGGNPAAALSLLEPLDLRGRHRPTVVYERVQTLTALRRRERALEEAIAFWELPGAFGTRRLPIAALGWRLAEELERWEEVAPIMAGLEGTNTYERTLWRLRRVIFASSRGRRTEAADALRRLLARSRTLRAALPADAPAGVAAGDPAVFEALRAADRAMSAAQPDDPLLLR